MKGPEETWAPFSWHRATTATAAKQWTTAPNCLVKRSIADGATTVLSKRRSDPSDGWYLVCCQTHAAGHFLPLSKGSFVACPISEEDFFQYSAGNLNLSTSLANPMA